MTDTVNFGLKRPDFDVSTWHDDVNNNVAVIDAIIKSKFGTLNVVGIWSLSTIYIANEVLADDVDGNLYTCLIGHTSASSSTFSADRIANPTYWELQDISALQTKDDFVASTDVYGVISASFPLKFGAETVSTSYVKIREFIAQRSGTYFAKTTLYGDATYFSFSKIYKNDVAFGTEHTTDDAFGDAFTETLGAFTKGDLIQVYMKVSNASIVQATLNVDFYVTNKDANQDKMEAHD